MIKRNNLDIIDRFFKDLARTMALLMGKSIEEKMEFYQKAYNEWLGLSLEEVEALVPEELLRYLLEDKKFDLPQLELLAKIMSKEASTYFDNKENNKANDRIRKALIIFEHINKNSDIFSFDRQAEMTQLNQLQQKTLNEE